MFSQNNKIDYDDSLPVAILRQPFSRMDANIFNVSRDIKFVKHNNKTIKVTNFLYSTFNDANLKPKHLTENGCIAIVDRNDCVRYQDDLIDLVTKVRIATRQFKIDGTFPIYIIGKKENLEDIRRNLAVIDSKCYNDPSDVTFHFVENEIEETISDHLYKTIIAEIYDNLPRVKQQKEAARLEKERQQREQEEQAINQYVCNEKQSLSDIEQTILRKIEIELKSFRKRHSSFYIVENGNEFPNKKDSQRYHALENLRENLIKEFAACKSTITKETLGTWRNDCYKKISIPIQQTLNNSSIEKYSPFEKFLICLLNIATFLFSPIKKAITGTWFYSTGGKPKDVVYEAQFVANTINKNNLK